MSRRPGRFDQAWRIQRRKQRRWSTAWRHPRWRNVRREQRRQRQCLWAFFEIGLSRLHEAAKQEVATGTRASISIFGYFVSYGKARDPGREL